MKEGESRPQSELRVARRARERDHVADVRHPAEEQNRALQSEPEPAVRAWAHVYLGRLAGLAQENEEAAGQFEDALKVEGATSAARDAAQKALEQLRKARP